MQFVKRSLVLKQVLIALIVIAWPLVGCEKNPGSSSPSAQAGAQGGQQALPGAAAGPGGIGGASAPHGPPDTNIGPTAEPPPIAPPVGSGPHPGLGGGMTQHPASLVMEQINLYRQRLEANPKDLEALIALGNANFDIQRFDKARELYLRALEVDPMNSVVRTDLASSYRNLGELELAFKELNHVLAIDSNHETALYNLGVLLLNDKHDPKGAIEAWEKLIATHPNLAYAPELKKKIEELNRPPVDHPAPIKGKN